MILNRDPNPGPEDPERSQPLVVLSFQAYTFDP